MSDILAQICARKREHIAERKKKKHETALWRDARGALPTRGFARTLHAKVKTGQIALIAEIKKASPSRGVIREDFNPATLAHAYFRGGATCLSVLTDTPFFQGEDIHLKQARNAVKMPVLRKDFILDLYQVPESRMLGADCILLILAALKDTEAREIEAAALSLGMDVLLEVHDRKELDRALGLKSPLIGINNRDLRTLEVRLQTTIDLAPRVPPDRIVICESGIATGADVKKMRRAGVYGFLVGESLMSAPDVTRATKNLLGLR